jgi:hypothetical protein
MAFGMIGWGIPLTDYPDTYNGQPLGIAALANQKHHMSLYLMGLYSSEVEEQWFRDQYAERGLRLDMGKSCVRFKRLEDVALDVVGAVIAAVPPALYIERYEAAQAGAARARASRRAARPRQGKPADPSRGRGRVDDLLSPSTGKPHQYVEETVTPPCPQRSLSRRSLTSKTSSTASTASSRRRRATPRRSRRRATAGAGSATRAGSWSGTRWSSRPRSGSPR